MDSIKVACVEDDIIALREQLIDNIISKIPQESVFGQFMEEDGDEQVISMCVAYFKYLKGYTNEEEFKADKEEVGHEYGDHLCDPTIEFLDRMFAKEIKAKGK